ncbi:hypothetical protein FOA52_015429 [Chlamydomonas sp. UWO 241]|nr:hypothetical protein FOA52_015429 [Chlamydomonas sp. UWO 241]
MMQRSLRFNSASSTLPKTCITSSNDKTVQARTLQRRSQAIAAVASQGSPSSFSLSLPRPHYYTPAEPTAVVKTRTLTAALSDAVQHQVTLRRFEMLLYRTSGAAFAAALFLEAATGGAAPALPLVSVEQGGVLAGACVLVVAASALVANARHGKLRAAGARSKMAGAVAAALVPRSAKLGLEAAVVQMVQATRVGPLGGSEAASVWAGQESAPRDGLDAAVDHVLGDAFGDDVVAFWARSLAAREADEA